MRNVTPQERAHRKRWARYKEEMSHEVCEANEFPLDTLENESKIEDFIIVAKALLFTAGHLSAPARFLYFVLFCHDWEPSERKRVCWPGGRRLAILMRCGRTQLSGYLKELRTTGLLLSKSQPNKPSRQLLKEAGNRLQHPSTILPDHQGSHA